MPIYEFKIPGVTMREQETGELIATRDLIIKIMGSDVLDGVGTLESTLFNVFPYGGEFRSPEE